MVCVFFFLPETTIIFFVLCFHVKNNVIAVKVVIKFCVLKTEN